MSDQIPAGARGSACGSLVSSVLSPTTMLATIPGNLMASAGALSLIVTTPTAASPSAAAANTARSVRSAAWSRATSRPATERRKSAPIRV